MDYGSLVNYKGDIGKKGGKFKRQKQTNKVYLVSPKVYRDGLLTFNFFDSGNIGDLGVWEAYDNLSEVKVSTDVGLEEINDYPGNGMNSHLGELNLQEYPKSKKKKILYPLFIIPHLYPRRKEKEWKV